MNPEGRPNRRLVQRSRALGAAAWLALTGFSASAQVSPQVVVPLELPAALTPLGQTVAVDWSQGAVIALGRSKVAPSFSGAQAEARGVQGARVDALRLLVAAVDALPMTSGATIAQCRANSNGLTLKIEAILKMASPVVGSERLEKQADGSWLASAAMSVPLLGRTGLWSAVTSEWAACAEPSTKTGLIVDARGLGFVPCLGFRFLTPEGTAFWDGALVRAARPNLPAGAGLAHSLEDATRQKDRVGGNPLTLKAVSAQGPAHCDLGFDADTLLEVRQSKLERALSDGRVVIVF